jgi:hypothetical protein
VRIEKVQEDMSIQEVNILNTKFFTHTCFCYQQ